MKFRGLISTSDVYEKRKLIAMRIQFAELCIDGDITNEDVYNTLSHLAQIEELNINLHRYENLRVYPNSKRLNSDMYLYARDKLKEAKNL